jgi:hypothetical protein
MAEKNTVFVELYDLKLSDRADDRMGRVVTDKSLTEDDLVQLAVKRGTDINPETLRASIKIIKEIAITEIANGASVQLGLGYFALDVRGAFIGDHAKWNPKVNSLHIRTTASAELRTAIHDTHVEVLGMASSGTIINSVTDVSTGEVNKCLTIGGGANIVGVKIKIAGPSPLNGIKLVDNKGIAFGVPAKNILVNDPKKITFIVSTVPKGDYNLRLTTQYSSSSSFLKDPRVYLFEHVLEVK